MGEKPLNNAQMLPPFLNRGVEYSKQAPFLIVYYILRGLDMEKPNIKWYEDDELTIGFSDAPHVCVRYILPSSTPDEVKSIKKYPFICKTTLKVKLFDHEKEEIYDFTIPKGYCYDGATINRFFWRIIGSKTDNTFLIGALIHDWMCEQKNCVNNDRNFSSRVFKALLIAGGVSEFKAQIMYLAVDNFQRFCGW